MHCSIFQCLVFVQRSQTTLSSHLRSSTQSPHHPLKLNILCSACHLMDTLSLTCAVQHERIDCTWYGLLFERPESLGWPNWLLFLFLKSLSFLQLLKTQWRLWSREHNIFLFSMELLCGGSRILLCLFLSENNKLCKWRSVLTADFC